MARENKSWGKIVGLRHTTKGHYCIDEQQRLRANDLVDQWSKENESATIEEQMNFARLLKLDMQIDAITNNSHLMDGTRADAGTMSEEEFRIAKREELRQLPKLQASYDQALAKTGKTGKDKRASEQLITTAQAAAAIFRSLNADNK